jgi:dihydrofolate reductase
MNDVKLVLYISMSLDGFIATEDDDLSWLSTVEMEGEDYGYGKILDRCDKYIVGRNTYEVIKKLCGGQFPHAGKMDCYVITSKSDSDENVQFYNGDLPSLIQSLRKSGKDIYCDGGAQLVRQLINDDLIDEYIISVIPILLGNGKRLFLGDTDVHHLSLEGSKSYKSGLVQLTYSRK